MDDTTGTTHDTDTDHTDLTVDVLVKRCLDRRHGGGSRLTPGTACGATSFDAHGAGQLAASVSLRREPFGALAYDFTTRRLSASGVPYSSGSSSNSPNRRPPSTRSPAPGSQRMISIGTLPR